MAASPFRLALSRRIAGLLISSLLLTACASGTLAPIEQKDTTNARSDIAPPRPRTRAVSAQPTAKIHVVVAGDSVHALAWRYGLDHRDLVRWNVLRNPDLIYVGQRLRLTAPVMGAVARHRPQPPRVAASPERKLAVARAPTNTHQVPRFAPSKGALQWSWPAQGRTTSATSISGSKGLKIRGTRGEDVKAASAGVVVYSGSGLRGYGQLIILKHNDTYLSAYAHNEARLVQEGATVNGGQSIARMGSTDAKDVMLHFEIRQNGKAVDPLRYLPKR